MQISPIARNDRLILDRTLLIALLIVPAIYYSLAISCCELYFQDDTKFTILLIPSLLVTTAICITSLRLIGKTSWVEYGQAWWSWFTATYAGEPSLAPAILTWCSRSRKRAGGISHSSADALSVVSAVSLRQKRYNWEELSELGFLLFGTIAICQVAFWGGYPLEYVVIPLLIWAAFRFGGRGATLLVVVAIAIYGTSHDFGWFYRQSIKESLLFLQSLIGVVALTTYILGIDIVHQCGSHLLTLINLFGNAIKFTECGKVTFTVEMFGSGKSEISNLKSAISNEFDVEAIAELLDPYLNVN